MIKKLLLSFALISTFGSVNSFAQVSCIPDLSCIAVGADHGICPDSTTGIPSGIVNQAYTTTMSIKIPSTTVSGGSTYNLTHFAVQDVLIDLTNTGNFVPLSNIGLSYDGSGSNTPSGASGISGYTMTQHCYWSAPGNGCVVVSGTPNTVGTFPIKITSQARALALVIYIWSPAPDNFDYKLVITAPASVETLDLTKFEVEQNAPNPFTGKSEIRFSSVNSNNVDFKVFNLLGSVVYSNSFKADKGANSINIEANTFAPGVYMYSIKNGDQTITKRMIVASK